MADLKRFESESTAWLIANCPPSQRMPPENPEDLVYGGRQYVFPSEDARIWLERMVAKGWTVPDWPESYGGAGLDATEQRILQKVMRRLGCRAPLSGHGVWMLGPALLEFGTEEQKRLHLPRKIGRAHV